MARKNSKNLIHSQVLQNKKTSVGFRRWLPEIIVCIKTGKS